jgi:hypothetical protein
MTSCPSKNQDADPCMEIPQPNRFILFNAKRNNVTTKRKLFCTSSSRTSYLPTLLAEMMSEGFNAWVLISFIESPWPTNVCMILLIK